MAHQPPARSPLACLDPIFPFAVLLTHSLSIVPSPPHLFFPILYPFTSPVCIHSGKSFCFWFPLSFSLTLLSCSFLFGSFAFPFCPFPGLRLNNSFSRVIIQLVYTGDHQLVGLFTSTHTHLTFTPFAFLFSFLFRPFRLCTISTRLYDTIYYTILLAQETEKKTIDRHHGSQRKIWGRDPSGPTLS